MLVASISSTLAVALTGGLVATHHEEPHVATPAEIEAWHTNYCDAYASGHPLQPLYVGNGKWMGVMSCDVNGV